MDCGISPRRCEPLKAALCQKTQRQVRRNKRKRRARGCSRLAGAGLGSVQDSKLNSSQIRSQLRKSSRLAGAQQAPDENKSTRHYNEYRDMLHFRINSLPSWTTGDWPVHILSHELSAVNAFGTHRCDAHFVIFIRWALYN